MPRATRNKKKARANAAPKKQPKKRGRPISDLQIGEGENATTDTPENAHARTCTHMQDGEQEQPRKKTREWSTPDQPFQMRKLQRNGFRMPPGRIKGTPLEDKIIELHLFKKWTAERVLKHLDNDMLTKQTIYGVCSRFRKRMRKLDDEATATRERVLRGIKAAQEPDANPGYYNPNPNPPKRPKPQKTTAPQPQEDHTQPQETAATQAPHNTQIIEGEVIESTEREERRGEAPEALDNTENNIDPLTTEEVFGLAASDPDSIALAESGDDPLTLRRKHKNFLQKEANRAMEIADNTGRAALTSTKAAQSSEASLRWIKAYQASISQFKELAGLETDKQSNGSGLHLHAHLHQGGHNPFLDA